MESGPGAANPDEVRRCELADSEIRQVFRLVHVSAVDDHALVEDMKSNAAKELPARGRERRHPEIHRGVSVFKSLPQAISRRQRIAARLDRIGTGEPVRIGDYVARLVLEGPGFGYEDRDEPDGHMTIWGEPLRLVAAVTDVSPADVDR